LETVWASILVDRLLKVFFTQTVFNYFLLLAICGVVLNTFDMVCKCDYNLKAALRLNTFMWLVIITIIELATGIL
jgi:hypothetical protein